MTGIHSPPPIEWITCENRVREVWKRLSNFKNVDYSLEIISGRHSGKGKAAQNWKKQAHQVRAAIIQADEYFEASRNSTLATALNLQYYGITALATAVMLIRGTGDFSLDRLRADPTSKSHGIAFSGLGINREAARIGSNLLADAYVCPQANGFFKNWYANIPSSVPARGLVRVTNQNTERRELRSLGFERIPDYGSLIGRKLTVRELMLRLPDTAKVLSSGALELMMARCHHSVHADLAGKKVTHTWAIYAKSAEVLWKLLEHFKFCSRSFGDIEVQHVGGGNLLLSVTECEEMTLSFPTIREDRNFERWIVGDLLGIPTSADIFLISFGLSMISRYFPDLWISTIEAHCTSALACEEFLEYAGFAFPIVALSDLHGRSIIITQQHPPMA